MAKRHIKSNDELGSAGKRKLIGVLLLWVIGIACILIWAVGAGITNINNKRTLLRAGSAATGTVSLLDSSYSLLGRYGGWNSYWVSYTFEPHMTSSHPGPISHREEIPASLYMTLKKGSSIEVTYQEDTPKINAPTMSLRQLSSSAKTAIRAACSLLVLVGLIYIDKKYVRVLGRKSGLFSILLLVVTGAAAGFIGGAVIGNAIIGALETLLF